MSGRSFAGVFRNRPVRERAIYAETRLPHIDYGWSPLAAYIDSDWKYIQAPRPELYDRNSDPQDRVDLVSSRPEIADALRSALAEMVAGDAAGRRGGRRAE